MTLTTKITVKNGLKTIEIDGTAKDTHKTLAEAEELYAKGEVNIVRVVYGRGGTVFFGGTLKWVFEEKVDWKSDRTVIVLGEVPYELNLIDYQIDGKGINRWMHPVRPEGDPTSWERWEEPNIYGPWPLTDEELNDLKEI